MRTERVARRAIPDFGRDVHCLLGVPVDAVDLHGALERIRGAAARRSRCFLSTPNVNFLVTTRTDAVFRRSLVNSDLSVADGMPLVWLAKLMGIPIPERVAGATLFQALGDGREPISVYFFGGAEGAAELAASRIAAAGRKMVCAGVAFPGFGSVEEMSRPELIGRINAARPDLLVVSLGARKGQAWIERNRHRLDVPVISHLGAVVDFAAGTQQRAPGWVQQAGLEWLWRIKERPQLWQRYLHDAAALSRLVVTRVVPCVWHKRRRGGQATAASVESREGRHTFVVRLHGAWVHSNLAPLRECLARASLAGKDVWLDLSGLTYLDSAALGLLMLLEGHQRAHAGKFVIASLPASVRRIFDYHGAEYLYAGAARTGAPYAALDEQILPDEAGG